jgi:two-component system sensor histidine kinase/response regulator
MRIATKHSAQNQKPSEMHHLPLADLTYLSENLEGDTEAISFMVESFLESLPSALSEIQESIEKPDLEQIRRVAHQVKSTSAAVGVLRLAAIAEKIETNIRLNIPFHIQSIMNQLVEISNNSTVAIRSAVQSLNGATGLLVK